MATVPRAIVLLAMLTLSVLQGCGATIQPPAAGALRDPAPVYLVDHGIHSSVLFPREASGTVVAFCFSSYDYAAKDHDGALNGPAALLIPNAGTLGRREFRPGALSERSICDAFMADETYYRIDRCYPIQVERARREAVYARLEQRFAAGAAASRIVNSKRRFTFVKDSSNYGLGHNCNAETAQWLRDMGCDVSGACVTADFTVEPAPKAGNHPVLAGGATKSPTSSPSRAGAPARTPDPLAASTAARLHGPGVVRSGSARVVQPSAKRTPAGSTGRLVEADPASAPTRP